MSWRYKILKIENQHGSIYQICESYVGDEGKAYGHTGPISPMGETPQELIEDLKMMLKDAVRSGVDEDYIAIAEDEVKDLELS